MGDAYRRSVRALRLAIVAACLTGIVAVVVPTASIVSAASVASAGTNDKARCVGAAVGSGGTIRVGAYFCYYDAGFNTTIAAMGGRTITYPSQTIASLPFSPRGISMFPGGEWYHGGSGYTDQSPICGYVPGGFTSVLGAKIYIGPQTILGQLIPTGSFFVECLGSPTGGPAFTQTGSSQATFNLWTGASYVDVNVCDYGVACSSAHNLRSTVLHWLGVKATFAAFVSDVANGLLPANWYPTGAQITAIDPFCGATVVSTWSKATGPNALEAVIKPGDRVPFTTTGTSGTTKTVSVSWHGSGFVSETAEDWVPHQIWTSTDLPTNPQSSGTDGSGGLRVEMRPNVTPVKLGDVVLRCENIAGGVFYKKYREVSVADLSPPDSNSACENLDLFWPSRVPDDPVYDVGEDPQFQISYLGPLAAGVTDEIYSFAFTNIDQSASAVPVADSARTWTAVTWITAGYSYPLTIATIGTISANAAYEDGLGQFRFRCLDDDGYHYYGVPPIVRGGATPEAGCLASSGINWAPSSWVPGLVSMLGCTLRVLFIPDEASLQALADTFDEVMTRVPFVYIAEPVVTTRHLGPPRHLRRRERPARIASARKATEMPMRVS